MRLTCRSMLDIIVVFMLLPGVVAAQARERTQAANGTAERSWGDLAREARLLREYQTRLGDYVALRSWTKGLGAREEPDASWFEAEDGTPSELLCLPDICPAAPVIGRDERQSPPFADLRVDDHLTTRQVLFSAELEELFRKFVATALPPIDQARVLRVMPLFPAGVPVQIVSEDLFRVLPRLPDGLEYRFRDRDLLVVDLDGHRVVDEIWLVLAASRT